MSNLKEFNEFAMESTETIQGGMRRKERYRYKTSGFDFRGSPQKETSTFSNKAARAWAKQRDKRPRK